MALTTVTITGRYLDLDGEPCSGTITFTPPCIVRDNENHVILSGPVSIDLDSFGRLNIELPCTQQDGLDPTDFCYVVTERLDCSGCVQQYPITLPCDVDTIDIYKLMPVPCGDDD